MNRPDAGLVLALFPVCPSLFLIFCICMSTVQDESSVVQIEEIHSLKGQIKEVRHNYLASYSVFVF